MSKDQTFVRPVSPETFEGLAKLGRKLGIKPLIDFISEDGSVRIKHEGDSYTVDPNGRCSVYTRTDQPFDLEPAPSNPAP